MQHSPSPTLRWQLSSFNDLTAAQLYTLLQARTAVFVVEQQCVFQDMDGKDPDCLHLLGWNDEQQLTAYLRIVPPQIIFAEASLGRVLTTSAGRRGGYGKLLLAEGIRQASRLYPGSDLRISAQQYLERFYQSFGFQTVSDQYLEDDIPHVEMLRKR